MWFHLNQCHVRFLLLSNKQIEMISFWALSACYSLCWTQFHNYHSWLISSTLLESSGVFSILLWPQDCLWHLTASSAGCSADPAMFIEAICCWHYSKLWAIWMALSNVNISPSLISFSRILLLFVPRPTDLGSFGLSFWQSSSLLLGGVVLSQIVQLTYCLKLRY